jgi:hypothetical protein
LIGLNLQPHKTLTLTTNYHLGQEQPNVRFFPSQTVPWPAYPAGGAFEPIANSPKGKLHIIDTYLTWLATSKLTFALEGDYVIERLYTNSAPQHTDGAAGYPRYQFTPKLAIAGRSEYLTDRGPVYGRLTGIERDHTYIRATYCGRVPAAAGMAPGFFEPSLLLCGHVGRSQERAKYRHCGSRLVVWREAGAW